MSRHSATSLAPGFRFHPTDEELVRYYLKRKVLNKPSFDAISVVDVYRSEPWDLPDSGLFCDVLVSCCLIFVWELTLGCWVWKGAFVLCRVFQKSGSGPKNGEQYGAPFIEEEWEDDEAIFVPGQHAVAMDEEVANYDAFVEVNDFDKNLDIGSPSENAIPPQNFYHGQSSNYVEYSREFSEDYQKPPGNMSGNALLPSNFYHGESSNHAEHSMEFTEDYQKPTVMHSTESDSKPHHEHVFSDLPQPNGIATIVKPVKDEYVVEPIENVNPADNNYFLDEPYLDVTDYLPANDGFFLEANDLSNPIGPESDVFDPDEYLTFVDADDQPLTFDSDQMVGSEIPVSDQEPLAQTHSNGGTEQVSNASERLEELGNSDASSSKQELEPTKFESGTKYPFLKQASHMLGSFPAPPAFASEFPSKDAALKLNSAAQASSSVHVVAGMIRITNMTSSGNQLDWSHSKNGNVNIVLSFSLPQGDVNSSNFLPMASLLSGKAGSVLARGWFFLMLLWVLIITVSLKFGTCIYTR
ncbi:hypothetical protein SCA6_000649 [Theobroma cacao]